MDTVSFYLLYDKELNKFRYLFSQLNAQVDEVFISGFIEYLHSLDISDFSNFSVYFSSDSSCYLIPPKLSDCEFVAEATIFSPSCALDPAPVPQPSFPLLPKVFH